MEIWVVEFLFKYTTWVLSKFKYAYAYVDTLTHEIGSKKKKHFNGFVQ